MKVELIHNTPLWVASRAIRKCWSSEDKSDTEVFKGYYHDGTDAIVCGTEDRKLIERVGNKNKHKSTLEHLVYTFDIDGISRACLQELARHRMASYSVKSTRYTLKELKDEKAFTLFDKSRVKDARKYVVMTESPSINRKIIESLEQLRQAVVNGTANDTLKYCLPEAYKTSLVMTINARSLQNFLELRTSKAALWEIRDLAKAMFDVLPEEHKYLFEECVSNYKEGVSND